jgi:hypothetical protein
VELGRPGSYSLGRAALLLPGESSRSQRPMRGESGVHVDWPPCMVYYVYYVY